MESLLDKRAVEAIIKNALREDVGRIDLTTVYTLPRDLSVEADILVKENGIVAGLAVAEMVYSLLDPTVRFKPMVSDGDRVFQGKVIAYLTGPVRPVLAGERVMLNLLSHLSGIATMTRAYVDAVKGYDVNIMDTRKTTPNLRVLEKYAVRIGGGVNHRMGLYDQVLIKDNHLKAAHLALARGKEQIHTLLNTLVSRARAGAQRNTLIEVEVHNLHQLDEALRTEADIIMLDNFSPEDVAEGVARKKRSGKNVLLEASGGIVLENVEAYAQSGVDRISIGALTHSARSLDISLDIIIR